MSTGTILSILLGTLALISSSSAYSKEESAEVAKLVVLVAQNSHFPSECESARTALIKQIKTEQRFTPKMTGISYFNVEIRCSEGSLSGVFSVIDESGQFLSASSYSMAVNDPDLFDDPATIKNFWDKLQDRIPWSGEIVGLKKATPTKEKGTNKDLPLRAKGFITMGSATNVLLGNCLPIEIGVPNADSKQEKADFHSVFAGIIREIGSYQSRIEIYTKDEKFDLRKAYVARLADPSRLPPELTDIIKDCQTAPSSSTASGLQSFLGNVFGKDPVEVNDIQQRYGAMVLNVSGTNGEKSFPMIGAYMHNRLLFGQNIFIDAFGVRSLYAKPYQELSPTSPVAKPELTIFEAFFGGRGKYKKINFLYGLGLILEKPNLPYKNPAPEGADADVSSRASSGKFGMIFGGSYVSDRITYGLRMPIAQSQSKKYIDFHLYGSYRLSSTWLGGLDMMFMHSQAREAGAPEAAVAGIGGFLGIEVGR